jgi:hypothetical protein
VLPLREIGTLEEIVLTGTGNDGFDSVASGHGELSSDFVHL